MGDDGPGAPRRLRCEYRTNPLGLDDAKPRLSWEINDSRRSAVQKAYQILVATDADTLARDHGNVWDSGRVESDQSVHVVYGGAGLESSRRYYWKVRTSDSGGHVSPYSEAAWWEMGLIGPESWRASWIAPGQPASDKEQELPEILGKWIWHPAASGDNTQVFFRASFELEPDAKVTSAVILASADDWHVAYLNGRKLGEGSGWHSLFRHDAAGAIQPGRNILAIEAHNATGPCGLIASMKVQLADGRSIELHSDGDWVTSTQADDNWTAPACDDSNWQRVTLLGDYGMEPWGRPQVWRGSLRSMCVRREISLKARPVRARAYVSGLGCYQMSINGQRIGDDVFTPGWTHYPKHIQYQTYDVTGRLNQGPNAIGAILGNTWWSGGLGWRGRAVYPGGQLRFLLQLDVEYQDGSREMFVTDDSWKTHPSPITRDSLYDGEAYDARLEMPGWDLPGFNDEAWVRVKVITDDTPGHLVAQRCETIRVTEQKATTAITCPRPGVYVFDFGQNLAGWVRLKACGPRGTNVRIRFAETLNEDGSIYTHNYRSARPVDEYAFAGNGEEIWEPRFTYRGFRYAELTGYPGEPTHDTLTAVVVHSDAPPAGTFACSNELLNRIHRNIVWGQRSNLHSVPTDCPQRDERLGWMGDAEFFAVTSCWNMTMASFYTKWMRDIRDSAGDDGHATNVAPVIVVTTVGAPGWGDAVTVIPWTVYQFYGDTRIIEENYDAMKGWVEYMRRHSENHLYEREGYGDWIAVDPSPPKPIGSAYYFYSTRLLSEMAAAIGRTDDARQYAQLAGNIADAFNDKYLDPETNHYLSKTQTANILPLWFGITPPDRQAAVLDNIVRDIETRGDHLSTGTMGTACLMPLLSSRGQQDLAYRLATQRTFPSWGYMVEKGATTIWELWDSDTKGPGMNSRNHFTLGTVGRWMFESLGGINIDPACPGFKRIVIRPQPIGDLKWVRCEYPSMYGLIRTAWRREDGRFVLDVTIPPNTSAQLVLPGLTTTGSTITESGKTILQGNQPAESIPGLRLISLDAKEATFDADAGEYHFVVEAGEK